jgi:uncharacterized protein
MMNSATPWQCAKCGHLEFKTGEIRASGGGLSSIFDVENERFSYVSCADCAYTEFYKLELSVLQSVLDFGVT